MTKITLSTVKSFVKKNRNQLFINVKSSFDGMVDGCMSEKRGFEPIVKYTFEKETMGIKGAWFVGGTKNYFNAYNDEIFSGFEVSNCCGRFILAVKGA